MKPIFSHTRPAGFTLIEFVVIIVIFATVAAVSLFNFRGFTKRIRVENLAQNIAITIREAQVLGSSRTAGETLTPTMLQFEGYMGVYIPFENGVFGQGVLPSGEVVENGFALFQDRNTEVDNDLTVDTDDVVVDILRLDSDDAIVDVKAGDIQTSLDTVQGGFYILFKRPSLSAVMFDDQTGQSTKYIYADIVVQSAAGETRTVRVTAGGQISVVE